MRTLIFCLLATICSMQLHAQDFYKVYTVKGKVTCYNKPVESGNILMSNWEISIPNKGKLVLLDQKHNTIITIRTAGKNTVDSFVKRKENKVQRKSGDYISFIVEKLTTKHLVDPSLYMQTSGNVLRRPTEDENKLENGETPIVQP